MTEAERMSQTAAYQRLKEPIGQMYPWARFVAVAEDSCSGGLGELGERKDQVRGGKDSNRGTCRWWRR